MSRPETGPMRFGDDWPGVFIRGDDAVGFAGALHALLRERENDCPPLQSIPLQDLLSTLLSCATDGDDDTPLQQVNPGVAPETGELLRAVLAWMDNDNPSAPEIIEAGGEWFEAGCPDLDSAPAEEPSGVDEEA